MSTLSQPFQTRLLTALNVRQHEADPVKWLFLHHFFQGFGVALLYAVANATFLAQFPLTRLPLALVAAAGALLVTGRIYAWLEHRVPLRHLMPGVVVALALTAMLAGLGLRLADAGVMAFGLIVAHRVAYLLTSLEFWGVSAVLLDVRQGKRLFGLISAGDVPAKLLGYLAVAVLGPVIGLPNLLLLAAAVLLASLLVLRRLLADPALATDPDHHHHAPSAHPGSRANWLQRLFQSPLIVALGGLSFLAVCVFTCIDLAFLKGAKARYGGSAAELAHFLGWFLGAGQALTIVTKLFFSGRIIERLGVKRALLLPPALLLLLAMGTALSGLGGADDRAMFLLFGLMLLVGETLRYTLHDPVFLALFQPLSRHLRLHGHTSVKGIVDPLALGTAGLLLTGLTWVSHGQIEPPLVNDVLIGLLVAWMAMVFVVNRRYLYVLSTAVRRRFLEGSNVAIRDQNTQAVLREKLTSAYPEEVIYALELLQQVAPTDMAATLAQLLDHPVEDVQLRALEKLDAPALRAAQGRVLHLAAHAATPRVRAAAVRAGCQLVHDGLSGELLGFLDDPDPLVRRATITGLLRAGGLEGVVMAGQRLLRLVESASPADRLLAAEIIGDLGVRTFYQPLAAFLLDADPAVRRAALEAAGALANDHLLPAVLACLPSLELADVATRALVGYGASALPHLTAYLQPAQVAADRPTARRVVTVIGRIGGPAAEAELLAMANTTLDRRLRENAMLALRAMTYQATTPAAREVLLTRLRERIAQMAWFLRADEALAATPTLAGVRRALGEEYATASESLFLILSLLYEPRTILKVKLGLENPHRETAANALEVLDNLLSKPLAAPLSALFERTTPAEKLRLLTLHVPTVAITPLEVLTQVLTAGTVNFNRWTVATALQAVDGLDDEAIRQPLAALTATYATSPEPLLRQLAAPARVLARPLPAGDDYYADSSPSAPTRMHASPAGPSLLEIEKVVVLKSTSIFAETPEHILVDIAAILHEERVVRNQVIFEQGDLGDSMYVIYQGEIRIHSGDTTFATFRNHDLFGELALLDPEPRSATATATTASLLLRLDQTAFYELMADRREVAQGILRVLTRRLRAQNLLLAQRK